jgi:hypothetical protein
MFDSAGIVYRKMPMIDIKIVKWKRHSSNIKSF